jgi:hypothetical protein
MGCKMIYVVETPKEVFWSKSKMDAQYHHVQYFWKNKAKYKEMTDIKFKNFKNISNKKFWELNDEQ